MKAAIVCLAVAAAAVAPCCLNDRDSLAAEFARRPELLWAITGRFERNPPLYYEMRIERVKAEITRSPEQLDLYDDISVAYDRIHKDDEALVWIEKKRSILERIDPKRTRKMDWYRYYANAGTFHAHRSIGLESTDPKEMEQAEAYIAKAIVFNPDAHGGREGYQLAAIRWLLSDIDNPFAMSQGPRTAGKGSGKGRFQEHWDGLAGLIQLGGAWESVDIYDALSYNLDRYHHQPMLGQLALLRRDELIASGKKAIGPLTEAAWDEKRNYAKENKREFEKLRADADAWHNERTEFMLARLRAGKHPDTDTDFWTGYIERPKPDIWTPPFWETMDWLGRAFFWGPVILVGGFALWAVSAIVRSVRRRKVLT